MKILVIYLISILLIQYSFGQTDLINDSRNNCVKIIIPSANMSGTGFFINEKQIVTCFHVIAKIENDGQYTRTTAYPDIKVVLIDNDTIDAICLTMPTNKDPAPFNYVFAVLQLKRPAKIKLSPNIISQNSNNLNVGDDIVFSGYPLSVPSMITHKGMISGISRDSNIICIQASINKGNSGGALIDSKGFVIGIISMREGGISQGLAELKT
jgi:S1-C subfamily serine protease